MYTRFELVDKVQGYEFEGYERTIDAHVKNLRRKLGEDARRPRLILTVYGRGYAFAEDAEVKRGLRLRLALTHCARGAARDRRGGRRSSSWSGARRFDSYLGEVQRSRNEAVVNDAQPDRTRRPTAGTRPPIYALSQVALLNNVDVAVYSPEGQLLFTVQGRHMGQGMMGGGRA